jgi:hypothetical protein
LFVALVGALGGSFSAFAQTTKGTVEGKVVDAKTGETLPGVKVTVDGLGVGALSDFDGNFTLSLPAGSYKILLTNFGYKNKTLSDVAVKAGQMQSLTVPLSEADATTLEAVTVTGTATKENATALLVQQKNLASVSDGISAESIRRTPDRNTGDVLKRVSGASIQDNKFAIVRGLNDRYNAAYLNGAPLPSTEADRKAFSFDIFPSALLENLVIVKSATPEMPGEFAGGVIQVNTKNFPGKKFHEFSVSGGYNTITTGRERLDYQGGKLDWLGVDDGSRSLPTQNLCPCFLCPVRGRRFQNLGRRPQAWRHLRPDLQQLEQLQRDHPEGVDELHWRHGAQPAGAQFHGQKLHREHAGRCPLQCGLQLVAQEYLRLEEPLRGDVPRPGAVPLRPIQPLGRTERRFEANRSLVHQQPNYFVSVDRPARGGR